jgi:hypothetical protein
MRQAVPLADRFIQVMSSSTHRQDFALIHYEWAEEEWVSNMDFFSQYLKFLYHCNNSSGPARRGGGLAAIR